MGNVHGPKLIDLEWHCLIHSQPYESRVWRAYCRGVPLCAASDGTRGSYVWPRIRDVGACSMQLCLKSIASSRCPLALSLSLLHPVSTLQQRHLNRSTDCHLQKPYHKELTCYV